jgi:hypothetical protein
MSSWLLRHGVTTAPPPSIPVLLSRALNVFTTTGTAANATSSNYNNILQMTAATGSVWMDISTLSSAQKSSLALYLYDEIGPDTTTLYFDLAHATGGGGTQPNLPTAYTIQGSTQAGGGGAAPTTGLSTLVTVTNGYMSRKHTFSAAGQNWVGIVVTASSGSNLQFKCDLWDVSGGQRDILHVGDSRVWFGLNHANPHGGTTACASLGDLMQPTCGFFAPTLNTGMSGAKAADIATLVGGWLGNIPTPTNATVNIGINDATATPWGSGWTTSFQSIVTQLKSAGVQKVFCETIGDSSNATIHGELPAYNSAIAGVITATSGAFAGFDEFAFFVANPSFLSGDGIHATDAGFAALRTAKAAFYASII